MKQVLEARGLLQVNPSLHSQTRQKVEHLVKKGPFTVFPPVCADWPLETWQPVGQTPDTRSSGGVGGARVWAVTSSPETQHMYKVH